MRIALLGYGVETQSAYKYFSEIYPDAQFAVYENAPEPKLPLPKGVEFFSSLENFYDIDADLVVKTPAIPPSKVSSRGKITSVTKEFFARCPAPIIGVTGTKGKGTTCTLIAKILEAAGKKVYLVGNIGVPALDELEKIDSSDIVVYELSSFQLWDLDKSPHVAVVLMVEQDHLNVHEGFDDYLNAKQGITKDQSEDDIVIYHPTNPESLRVAQISKGKKQKYMSSEGVYIRGEQIVIDEKVVCKTSEVGLIGQHNLENVCAAITAAWNYTQDISAIAKAVKNFKGLPHHIERVRQINDVVFYDDSFSSAPGASVAAIKSFKDPEVVILGGQDKGSDFTELVATVKSTQNIKKVLLIGESKDKLAELLKDAKEERFEIDETRDFEKIVERAYELAKPGGIVLLSPGSASFDMFKNFYERGDMFKKIVAKL